MRRTSIAILIVALLAMVGAGIGIGLAASSGASTRAGATTAITASATKKAPPNYVVADCSQLQVMPGSYVFTCADAPHGGVATGVRPAWPARS